VHERATPPSREAGQVPSSAERAAARARATRRAGFEPSDESLSTSATRRAERWAGVLSSAECRSSSAAFLAS
jgi:hypothetical protein